MTPQKRLLLNSILGYTTELNWSIAKVESLLLNGIENKVSKSRTKKLINELYNDYINNTDYDFKRSKVNSFFDEIGWFQKWSKNILYDSMSKLTNMITF